MLPQGFTRVEYIESTGTQYIDTGFKPNQNTRVIIDYQITTAQTIPLFGARNGSTNREFEMFAYADNRGMQDGYGSSQDYVTSSPNLNRTTIDKNKNVTTSSDGSVNKTHAAQTFQCSYNMYLFQMNNGGQIYNASYGSRCYSCQIYDNGTLVRDYIPCQTDTGAVGLYDMTTATFYGNDGTGEFLAGGVIVDEDVPDVPEALEYTLAGNIVALTWSASSGAEKYRVYRDGALIVETESTEYTDTVAESPVGHVYAVTAVNEYGESALSESVRADIWGDTAPELIYDRTQADVNDAKALISKYMRDEVLDGYEQELWERGLRGCYNTSDVNRVEYHTRELQNILNSNGYNIQIDTRLWSRPDIMRYSDIVRYLGNINAILDAFGHSANAPKLPGIDRWIDYIAANDIEKILYVTRELVCGALAMFRRAGTFASGNDYVTQVIRRA
jgi:hypothetical protein